MVKPLFAIAILGAGAFMFYRLNVLSRFGKNVHTTTELSNADIIDIWNLTTLGTLRLFVDVKINNPQSSTHTITHPHIQLFDKNNNRIASSTGSTKTYTIQTGLNTIEGIEIRVPVRTIINAVSGSAPTLEEIMAVVADANLSTAEKISRVYELLYGTIQGKELKTVTKYSVDGVAVSEEATIKF